MAAQTPPEILDADLAPLLVAIVTQWIIKSGYEVLATPLTYGVVGLLKREESADVYDVGTGIPKGPVATLSPEWLRLVQHAAGEHPQPGDLVHIAFSGQPVARRLNASVEKLNRMNYHARWEAGPQGPRLIPAEAYGIKMISMGLLVKPGQPLIWRGPMLNSAIRQFLGDVEWGELDYLIIDLPPGTGDASLSLAQALPLSGAVMRA